MSAPEEESPATTGAPAPTDSAAPTSSPTPTDSAAPTSSAAPWPAPSSPTPWPAPTSSPTPWPAPTSSPTLTSSAAPTKSAAPATKWTTRNKWAVGISVVVVLAAVAANNKKKREQSEHHGHGEDERQTFAKSFQETLRRNGGDPLVRVRAADTAGTTLVIETKDCSGVSEAFGDYRLREDTRNDYGFTKVSCEFDHRALWSKDL